MSRLAPSNSTLDSNLDFLVLARFAQCDSAVDRVLGAGDGSDEDVSWMQAYCSLRPSPASTIPNRPDDHPHPSESPRGVGIVQDRLVNAFSIVRRPAAELSYGGTDRDN
jgi:hypothetical protein